ncbi:D-alanyl-D-alanine carboxypeptidase family protein [Actinocorallia longicatena]|uniref:Peptidase S11 D-alanyl-D-alanine carboxypeptidase A N-terminal domain-containing protein n=1 Tax=Actinocorallia longicatena TaxID=111803 RepID=A0ABP6QBU5_9ACTN
MLRKLTASVLAAALLATGAPAAAEAKARPKAPAGVSATSAILYDSTAKKTLWKRNVNKRMPVGSMNKVALALVVIKAGHLKTPITIRQKYKDWVDGWGASQSHLVPGDRLSAYQLLQATLVESGCDAAYALADAYGGSAGYLGSLAKMNALARKLGMRNTHYASFDGTPAKNDYTTAADQLKLARYAMKSATFRSIVKIVKKDFRSLNGRVYKLRTSNLLLKNSGSTEDNSGYPGVYGIKTGSTGNAGGCFMFVARRKKHTVYGVVLRSSSTITRFQDAAKMLNWAYGTRNAVTLTPPPPREANG